MKHLPPDPQRMNENRSMSAGRALRAFMRATGADLEDAPSGLLANLMHWCDRHDQDFNKEYARAVHTYIEDTTIPYTVESEDITDAI